MAQRDSKLMEAIHNALASQENTVVCTDMHRISFLGFKQTAIVEALSDNSPFSYKIVPKAIKFSAVIKMLNGEWEDICEGDIIDAN